MLSFVRHRNMKNEFFLFLSLNYIEYKIVKKKVSLDYYLNAITVLFCTTTIWTTKEKRREEREKRKSKKRIFSHCSYDRITRNGSSSRKQHTTYQLIPFSSLLLSQWWVIVPIFKYSLHLSGHSN